MRRQTAGEVVFGAVVVAGALAALLLAGAAAEMGWHMGTGLRSLWFWTFLAGGLALVAALIARPIARLAGWVPGLDERAAARRAGRVRPEVADRLTALLDLADGRTTAVAGPLLDGAVRSLGDEVSAVPFERVEDLRPARRAVPWAGAPVLGLAAFLLLAPGPFTGAVNRLFAPATEFRPPAPFALHVQPGDAEVGAGEALALRARAVGRAIPPDAELEVRRGRERTSERMRLRRSGDAFEHTLRDMSTDLHYRFTAGPVETRWYRVSVVPSPVVRALQVVVEPPSRTGERTRRLPPGVGDVTGLAGTVVRVTAGIAGTPAERAELVFETEEGRVLGAIPMRIDGDRAGAAFILRRGGAYRVRLVAENGRENAAPVRYRLGVLGDAPPAIALVEGGRGALPEAARRLVFHVSDDFGFRSLNVVWRRIHGESRGALTRVPLPVSPRLLEQEITWAGLGAAARNLPAGAVIELYGEVRDNDAAAGFKPARTPLYVMRVPTLVQRLDRVDAEMDSAAADLQGARDDAREARRLTGELRERLRADPQAGAEERRMLERVRERQERALERVEEVQATLRQSLEEMRSGMAEEETSRLYEAMEEMLEQLQDPELREALERLAEAMENLDFQEMMQALGEMERSESSLQEQIERAMELLERLETARELDEAARRAEDLAQREEAIREETRRLEQEQQGREGETPEQTRERLADEQREAAEDAESLMQQLRELQEQMEGQRGAPDEAMEQLMEETGAQEMPQEMQENADQLESGELDRAQQQQRQMSQRMQRMSQQMRQMSSQMQGQQQQANVAGIRRALDDVLTLSQEEERAADEAGALTTRSPAVRAHARRQVELAEGAVAVRDTLRSLARSIPQLAVAIDSRADDALREMGQATQRLADGEPAPAAGHQRTAMAHLNDLALLLADLLEQMQAQQMGGGAGQGQPTPQQGQQLGQQMQRMSQQQQGLSQRIQQFLNQSAGQRLTPGQQGAAERLAQQQDELRRQLEELSREGAGRLDPRTRSALRRAAEAMDRTARELRSGRLTPETMARQTEILQRLLESEESINEREREERRESQRGRDMEDPERPSVLPPIEGPAERLRRELLRALDAGYAPDYEDLIRRYFERLRGRGVGGG